MLGGLVVLVKQAVAHEAIDDGQVGEALAELNRSVWPRPQAFAVQEELEGPRFVFAESPHSCERANPRCGQAVRLHAARAGE